MTQNLNSNKTHVNIVLPPLSFAGGLFCDLRTPTRTLTCIFFAVMFSVTLAPIALAQTPCEKAFQKYYKKYLKPISTHYAVATTGGRSLASPSTACAISSGQVSKNASMKEAIKTCKLEKRSTGYLGACTVIKSR